MKKLNRKVFPVGPGSIKSVVRVSTPTADFRIGISLKKGKEISDNLGSYFIVRDDEKVIGYANGKMYPTKPFNEFSGIYLLSEYQRKGIGTQLAEVVLASLGKGKDVIVEVVGYNQRAINFYEKLGFVFVVELEKFEITDGIWVPEVRMLKKSA